MRDVAKKTILNKNEPISLTYVEKGQTYHTTIDRASFINQMEHMVTWYPGCNENATRLCELLPNMESITVNNDIIQTQDIPFFEYQSFGDEVPHCMKFMRFYKIVWSFLMFHCEQAKNNSSK